MCGPFLARIPAPAKPGWGLIQVNVRGRECDEAANQ
jgi:hypothetical protein